MISESLITSSGSLIDPNVRKSLVRFEDELKAMPQVDIPVNHYFGGGAYAREITIPAGVALTGRIYKDDHIDIMVSGEMVVTTEGEEPRYIEGFNIIESKQGKKRAGYAISDTHWITVHLSKKCSNVDDYIDEVSVESFQEYDQFISSPKYIDESQVLSAFSDSGCDDYHSFKAGYLLAVGAEISEDRDDYLSAIGSYGIDEDQVRMETEISTDLINIDTGEVYIGQSVINGRGLFCRRRFSAGDTIMKASINGCRTIAGRYTNHAKNPNAEFVFNESCVDLVAIKNIDNEEITTDYRVSMKKRFGGDVCQA